jgi:hypothetical protein
MAKQNNGNSKSAETAASTAPEIQQDTGAEEAGTFDFLCTVSWEHSGRRSYRQDEVYPLSAAEAGELMGLDRGKPLGALEYFAPSGAAAQEFLDRIKAAIQGA